MKRQGIGVWKGIPHLKYESKWEFIVYLLLHPSLGSQAAHPHTPAHTHAHAASSNMSIDDGLHNPISCASCAKPSEVWHTERVHGE